MDLLMGEDETLPGKRLALICKNCRLVNGQAPPGVQRLEDVGLWRCGGCGVMNGEERGNEIKRIVRGVKEEQNQEQREQESKSAPRIGKELEEEEQEDEEECSVYESEGSDGGNEKMEMRESVKKSVDAMDGTPRRRSTRTKGQNSGR